MDRILSIEGVIVVDKGINIMLRILQSLDKLLLCYFLSRADKLFRETKANREN